MKTKLKRGDRVVVISGGNSKVRPIKGKIGTIKSIIGENRERAIVEGLNIVTRHQRAKGPGKPAGKVPMEAPIHVSRLMYYVDKLNQPVKLMRKVLEDGEKVRGYRHPESGEFVQIAEG